MQYWYTPSNKNHIYIYIYYLWWFAYSISLTWDDLLKVFIYQYEILTYQENFWHIFRNVIIGWNIRSKSTDLLSLSVFQLSSCLPLDVLKFNEKTGIVILRVPKDNYAKVRAALTVCPSMRVGAVDVPVIYTTQQASSCLLSLAGPERSIVWTYLVLRL